MNNIVLKNNFIELRPSEKDRPKSYVSFEVVDVVSSQHLFEIFTEGENLTDGYFKMQFSSNINNNKKELIIEAIKLFVDFCFMSWPINKIYYETYQNDTSIIKMLIDYGFKVEANLFEDCYIDGKYIDKIILALYR